MNIPQIEEMLDNGKTVTVQFNSNVYYENEDKFDDKMKARVVSIEQAYDNYYVIAVDGTGFEEENRKVAKFDWFDAEGLPTLCWMDTKDYPENGTTNIYTQDKNLPFEVVQGPNDYLFSNYKKSGFEGTYVEWLENLVTKKGE